MLRYLGRVARTRTDFPPWPNLPPWAGPADGDGHAL